MSTHIQAEPIPSGKPESPEFAYYPPSFIDRWLDGVQKLRIPYGWFFFILIVLQTLLAHILAWIDGWLPTFTFSPLQLIYPIWLWGCLAAVIYLKTVARQAFDGFRPLLDVDEKTADRLRYEFNAMTNKPVILSGLAWLIVFSFLSIAYHDIMAGLYGFQPWYEWVLIIEGAISFFFGSVIYYHSIRQLLLINRVVKMVKHINLFKLDPVYSFSRLTSRIGILWMLLLTLTMFTFPIKVANIYLLALFTVQMLLALAAFILPLGFVNRLLVAEKRKLQAEHNLRTQAALDQLHTAFQHGDPAEAGKFNDALGALAAEHGILSRIPTWPWRAGTLTSFLSALVLPVVLFLIQFVIGRWLGQ